MTITGKASDLRSIEIENDDSQGLQEFNINEAQLCHEADYYDVNSSIDLSIIFKLSNEIIDYSLECNGFEKAKDVIVTKDIITFLVKYDGNIEKPYINFTLNLTGNVNLSKSLYGYLKQDKIFISRSSFRDAEEAYIDYLQENDIDEYERLRSKEMPCDDPIKPSNFMNSYIFYIINMSS